MTINEIWERAAADRDPFHSASHFRETAESIPNTTLILYPKRGHAVGDKQFRRDLAAFLLDDSPEREDVHR